MLTTIFKYERLPKICVDSTPKNWGIRKSENVSESIKRRNQEERWKQELKVVNSSLRNVT